MENDFEKLFVVIDMIMPKNDRFDLETANKFREWFYYFILSGDINESGDIDKMFNLHLIENLIDIGDQQVKFFPLSLRNAN